MQWAEVGRSGATQGLAVDGDVFDGQGLLNGRHPRSEAGLKGMGLEPIEDTFEGVMRGDAVGQFEKPFEPVAALTTKGLDLLPILSAGNDGTQSNDDDILEQMQAAVCSSGVLQLPEVVGNRQINRSGVQSGGRCSHDSP